MQKIILFDPLTADDVKSRIDTINRENNYLNAIHTDFCAHERRAAACGRGPECGWHGVVINFPDVAEEAVGRQNRTGGIKERNGVEILAVTNDGALLREQKTSRQQLPK